MMVAGIDRDGCRGRAGPVVAFGRPTSIPRRACYEAKVRTTPLMAALIAGAIGCSHSAPRTVPPVPPTLAPAPAAPPVPPSACFLLYEMGVGEVRRSPASACTTRVTPASTFKVPHALAGLDSGVLAGPDVTVPYDGTHYSRPAWERDQTLRTAIRHSVVWYFQRVATQLGPAREQEYLAKFDYGNRDSSSGLTTFWLGESLLISPEEEQRFLVRLYDDKLPVSKEAMRTVRELLVQPPGVVVNAVGEHPFDAPWPPDTVVSAKTGAADHTEWLVGHVQRGPRAWVFVSCVNGETLEPTEAIDLAAKSLREARVL